MKKYFLRFLAVVSIIILLMLAFLAGKSTVSSVQSSETEKSATLWTVKNESIGSSIRLQASVKSHYTTSNAIGVDGLITSIDNVNSFVLPGDILVSVNLRPVVVAQGDIPLFRSLKDGDTGKDVVQLRKFLCSLGHGKCSTNDVYDSALYSMVKKWQKKLGIEQTGIVEPGDIVYVPSLPARVVMDSKYAIGANISAQDQIFSYSNNDLQMLLTVKEEQLSLLETGNKIHIDNFDDVDAYVGELEKSHTSSADEVEEENMYVNIVDIQGKGICESYNDVCVEILNGADSSRVLVSVENIPEQKGLAVPVMAINTDARGQTYVVDESGKNIFVSVVASDSSLSIVEGIDEGIKIYLYEDNNE
ncbi:MAG: peptidoglycan-binding protein [Actinomycetaceae bacterium]|nr:peptidoglycan-binding protein [Actinomycetaceae bacterium]